MLNKYRLEIGKSYNVKGQKQEFNGLLRKFTKPPFLLRETKTPKLIASKRNYKSR